MKKLTTVIIGILATISAHAVSVDSCIDSYEGVLPLRVAEAGCTLGILTELTDEQYNLLYNQLELQELSYCTPELPAYYKPWLKTGETPCAWAGYSCDTDEECATCDAEVESCQI